MEYRYPFSPIRLLPYLPALLTSDIAAEHDTIWYVLKCMAAILGKLAVISYTTDCDQNIRTHHFEDHSPKNIDVAVAHTAEHVTTVEKVTHFEQLR